MRYLYYFLLLLFLSFSGVLNAQYGSRVTIIGSVTDSKTQRPVEFANIGFVGVGVGTVSDADGNFTLNFAPGTLKATDKFQVSVIGYLSQTFSKNDVLRKVGSPFNISLKAEPYSLDEVIVGETKRTKSTIGDLDYDERIIGYWKDIEGLGGEITTKVKVRRKNTKLHNLTFKVLDNGADSLLVRVNVYDVNDYGLVGQNLLNQSIKHTISERGGEVTIPLSEYGIYVHSNIIVGIELLKVYGRQIGFSLSGSRSKGISFIRYRSQDFFKPVENTSMAFKLEISTPARKGSGPEERELPEFITLYWDASALSDDRNIEKELDVVDEILDKTREAQVDVVKFAQGYEERKTFYMHKGKTSSIIDFLENTNYSGTANFIDLPRPETKEKAAVILVTQGQTVLSKIKPDFPCPVFALSSNYNASKVQLEELSFFTDGDFLDASLENRKELLKRYTHFIEEKPIEKLPTAIASGTISYKSKEKEIPLQGATVSLQDSYTTVQTDVNGNYRIAASPDDILDVSFPGMNAQSVEISERGRKNVVLTPIYDVLDEVVLTGKKEEKELVQTTQGMRDADAVGYANNLIKEEEITSQYTTLGQVLQREAGVEVRYDPFTRREVYIFPRTFYNSILTPQPPIIVIDGVIYDQTDDSQLPELDMQNIKSINPNSSLMATTRYGSIAAGGVIEIKTKTGNTTSNKKVEKPSALAKGNEYTEVAKSMNEVVTPSDVYRRLLQATSPKGAQEVYFNLLKTRSNPSVSFYMDAYEYFKKNDPVFAPRVITSVVAKAPNNKQALRTAAYALEELSMYDQAVSLYEHIKNIAPSDVQSHLDLARAYDNNKEYKKAFEGYKTILTNEFEEIDFASIQETAENELRRLAKLHRSRVSFKDLPDELLRIDFKKDIRLVFEWSDPAVQFELQFVSPDQKFFTWEHTMEKNATEVSTDLKVGKMIKEFELDSESQGEWLINLSVLNDNMNPKTAPYLKYTLYRDYATSKEKKELKIIPLEKIAQKTTIDNITINQSTYEN